MERDLLRQIAIPQSQGLLQQLFHGQGKTGGGRGGGYHPTASSNQVPSATLMGRFQELVVQLQPVMDQPTRVVSPQNRLRLVKTPSRQNLAVGDLLRDDSPEPAQLRI